MLSKQIKFPRIPEKSQIEKWEEIWNKADNISFVFPDNLSVNEITGYYEDFKNKLPSSFASSVLSAIAEFENTPVDILNNLFDAGDTACMVAICCRTDLNETLLQRCLNSSNPDVLEHIVFNKRTSIEECEKLLQRPLEGNIKEAISRAILQKKK